jgi:hypothetical protein
MSVNIEASAQSMSESLDSLKETPLVMHRLYFELNDISVWYAIMHEARVWFGKNWKAQKHSRRKLESRWDKRTHLIWFEVPDSAFGSWVAIKLAVRVTDAPNK